MLYFQVDRQCVECRYETTELLVNKIIPHKTTLGFSRMDFSFLSKKKNLLLALIEVKADNGRFELLKTSDALRQTACYSILPLAFSRWGIASRAGDEALDSLLIFPDYM